MSEPHEDVHLCRDCRYREGFGEFSRCVAFTCDGAPIYASTARRYRTGGQDTCPRFERKVPWWVHLLIRLSGGQPQPVSPGHDNKEK